MEDNKPKISNNTKWLMLGVAIFFDVLQWILVWVVMDWVVVWIAAPTFILWFLMVGKRFSLRQIVAFSGGTLVEGIPVLGDLPVWTGLILYLTRVEPVIEKTASVVPGGKTAVKAVTKAK